MNNDQFFPVSTRPRGGRRTAQEMYPVVKQWLESGELQADFCRRHSMKVSLLAYWLKKYRFENDPGEGTGGFVPVKVSPAREREVEICFPDGVTIRTGPGAGARFLRELAGQC